MNHLKPIDPRKSPLAVLDIGSSKIACLLAAPSMDGELQLRGYAYHASQGIKGGNIVDIDAACRSIRQAIQGTEHMAGMPVERLLVNLSAGQPSSYHVTAEITLGGRATTDADLQRALIEARKSLPDNSQILAHALPISYALDDDRSIDDPRGLVGDKLSITTHLVAAGTGPVRTLLGVLTDCEVEARALVLGSYASGLAVLTPDEMALGATVIDMGGGMTSFAMFQAGRFTFADRVGIGGQHVTSDLARGLGTPLGHAERLKCLYGQAMASHLDERDLVTVPQLGDGESVEQGPGVGTRMSLHVGNRGDRDHDQQVPKAYLARIIRPRLEETFELLAQKIAAAPPAPFVSGGNASERFVLTGGASQLPGVRELAQHILGRPVRYGVPRPLPGMEEFSNLPAFATALGLVSFTRQPSFAGNGEPHGGNGSTFSRLLDWAKRHL